MRICALGPGSVCGLVLSRDLGMVLLERRVGQTLVAGMYPGSRIPTVERSYVDGKLLGSARWWKWKGFAPRAFTVSLIIKSMCSKLSSLQPPSGVSRGELSFSLSAVLIWGGGGGWEGFEEIPPHL